MMSSHGAQLFLWDNTVGKDTEHPKSGPTHRMCPRQDELDHTWQHPNQSVLQMKGEDEHVGKVLLQHLGDLLLQPQRTTASDNRAIKLQEPSLFTVICWHYRGCNAGDGSSDLGIPKKTCWGSIKTVLRYPKQVRIGKVRVPPRCPPAPAEPARQIFGRHKGTSLKGV